jgi:hypothetical protein
MEHVIYDVHIENDNQRRFQKVTWCQRIFKPKAFFLNVMKIFSQESEALMIYVSLFTHHHAMNVNIAIQGRSELWYLLSQNSSQTIDLAKYFLFNAFSIKRKIARLKTS